MKHLCSLQLEKVRLIFDCGLQNLFDIFCTFLGSYQTCKALLEAYANRDITDHMERLPRDIACERLHHDIVRLLDEHVPRSPQMVNVVTNSQMLSKSNLLLV